MSFPLKKLFLSQKTVIILYLISIGILLYASFQPVYQNFKNAPGDRYYYGGDGYPLDLTGDITTVRQGYEGHWSAFYNITTTVKETTSLLKSEYILIGKFSRVFHLDPLTGFYVARSIISVAWFIALYCIVRKTFTTSWQHLLALLIILFSATIYDGTPQSFIQTGAIDAQGLFRFTQAMPHYLLGGLTSILSLFFLSRVLEKGKRHGQFVIALLLGMWSSMLYGPNNVLILAGLPFYVVVQLFFLLRKKITRKEFFQAFLLIAFYGCSLCIPILYVRFVVASQLRDFNLNTYVEKLNPFNLNLREYFLTAGMPLLFSWLAIISILKKKRPFITLLFPWAIIHPFAGPYLSKILDLNQIRFYLVPYYVVFGILAVEGISAVTELVPHQVTKVKVILITFFAALCIIPGIPGLYANWVFRLDCFCTYPDWGYPRTQFIEAINWLRDNTNDADVVLSTPYAGTLIPPFAGNLVYTSWWFQLSNTQQFWEATNSLQAIYYGGMNDTSARFFFEHEKISYVFYGPEERELNATQADLHYANLKEVYRNNMIVIYKVVPVEEKS